MDFLKKYLIGFGIILGNIMVLCLIVTLLSYFNLIGNGLLKWLKLIIPIVSALAGGIYLGRKSQNKGYLEGIKLGGGFVLFMFLFAILGFGYFKWMLLFYYIILVLTTMLGSMIGINRKKENN